MYNLSAYKIQGVRRLIEAMEPNCSTCLPTRRSSLATTSDLFHSAGPMRSGLHRRSAGENTRHSVVEQNTGQPVT